MSEASIQNLISLLGLLVMIGLAVAMSSHRRRISWRLVMVGVGLQLLLGAVLFNSQTWTLGGRYPDGILFTALDGFFGYLMQWTEEGAAFVFRAGGLPEGDTTSPLYLISTFAFGVLPTVIFFASLMSVLYYLRIMRPIVGGMAWVMRRLMGTSGSESLAAAANVFVGHTEAPLVVKPFIPGMTRSELNALMVGGFATITGGLMAIFVAEGISAGHLVTASIVSAPAALVIAKILQPETETPETLGMVRADYGHEAGNVIEAAAAGASEGMKLAINIAAMLIAFLALIAMVNTLLFGLGELVEWGVNLISSSDRPVEWSWSLSGLFGLVFWPLAWVMGIVAEDCVVAGELLGTKMVVNEFVAYVDLGAILRGERVLASPDGGEEVVRISERSHVILTYALCGFSNFGAIGIQLGGIGAIAPERRGELAQLGLRAMLGGTLACCMTACVAGLWWGILN